MEIPAMFLKKKWKKSKKKLFGRSDVSEVA